MRPPAPLNSQQFIQNAPQPIASDLHDDVLPTGQGGRMPALELGSQWLDKHRAACFSAFLGTVSGTSMADQRPATTKVSPICGIEDQERAGFKCGIRTFNLNLKYIKANHCRQNGMRIWIIIDSLSICINVRPSTEIVRICLVTPV